MSICQSVHRLLHEDPRRLTEPKDYEEESVQALEVYDETINALGEAPCANDDEFFITAANIVEAELEEYGEPNHSKDFHESVLFLCRYIAQRKARSQR